MQVLVILFVIYISADCVQYCAQITHLELSIVFSLVISPSTDIAANVRALTLLYATNPFMENETMGPSP